MAAAPCRSNCPACRSSMRRETSSAIAASASAAISTPSRGSPPCVWRNCPARWRRRNNRPLRHLPSRPAPHRLRPTNCLNRLPNARNFRCRDFCCRDFTSKRFGNARGTSQGSRRGKRPGVQESVRCRNRQGHADGNRNGVAGRRAANVLPFRAPGEAKQPALTPVENNAFDELARQLSARLDTENGNGARRRRRNHLRPAGRIGCARSRRTRRRNGWRRPSRRRAAKPRATRRCSICCRSAS